MDWISERAGNNPTIWTMLNKGIGRVEDCVDHCGPEILLLSRWLLPESDDDAYIREIISMVGSISSRTNRTDSAVGAD